MPSRVGPELRDTVRPQISADAFAAYVWAIDRTFGRDVDFAQIVKFYEAEPIGAGRYSPPRVEPRFDQLRRKTQSFDADQPPQTDAVDQWFQQKRESLEAAVSLYLAHYNMVRLHGTLKVTPAMAAGVTDRIWTVGELLDAQASF